MRWKQHRVAALWCSGAAAVAMVGCGTSAGSSAPLSPGTSATGSSSGAPPSGVFKSSSFRPRVSFTLPAGFMVAADNPDIVYIANGSDAVNIIRAYSVWDPQTEKLASPPADLFSWLSANPYLQAGSPSTFSLGQITGRSLDVTVVKAPPPSSELSCTDPDCLNLLFIDNGTLTVIKGERLRFMVVYVSGHIVTVEMDAIAAGFDPFFTHVKTLLTSMTFAS